MNRKITIKIINLVKYLSLIINKIIKMCYHDLRFLLLTKFYILNI